MHELPIVRLRESLLGLLTCLRGTASDVERTLSLIDEGVGVIRPRVRPTGSHTGALVLDRDTFAVSCGAKTCYLGCSIPYRVMEVLAGHPNQYVSHQRLLDLAWHGPRSDSTVRSAIRELRARLTEAGLVEVAAAIDGRNGGYYRLLLNRGLVQSEST